jgi:hypothetical protein
MPRSLLVSINYGYQKVPEKYTHEPSHPLQKIIKNLKDPPPGFSTCIHLDKWVDKVKAVIDLIKFSDQDRSKN